MSLEKDGKGKINSEKIKYSKGLMSKNVVHYCQSKNGEVGNLI
jgi:hypothetical protein